MREASNECVWSDYYPHQDPFTLSGRPVEHLGGDLDLSPSTALSLPRWVPLNLASPFQLWQTLSISYRTAGHLGIPKSPAKKAIVVASLGSQSSS